MGVLFDVTEQHRINDQLRQSQKMEAVGQLTGGLAHDFNNLLAGMSGALQLLDTHVRGGEINNALMSRYITTARGAADRAAALTHRLLAFARKQPLKPTRVNAFDLACGIEDLIRRTVGPHIVIEITGPQRLWSIMVDSNQLENALVNLCVNAKDAMPSGGTITIQASNQRMKEIVTGADCLPAGDYVCLTVSDTGTGMDQQTVSRAFDPFFTTKPLGAGTGLGLSMVYGFARQSNGLARIDSMLGKGTKVSLLLPRYCEADVTSNEEDDIVKASAPIKIIVLVDDEPIVRDFVKEVLENEGYAVFEAEDAAAGLALFKNRAVVDLLVSDIGLPGEMNGRQMVSAIRQSRPNLNVLFITGYAGEEAVGSEGDDAKTQLLTKPFLIETLVRRVSMMLAD